MRKSNTLLLAAIAALALPATVAAQDAPVPAPAAEEPCQIIFDTSAETETALRNNGLGFAGYATLCPLLRDAGLGVSTDGATGMVLDTHYALTELKLYDIATHTRGWFSATSTSLAPNLPDVDPARLSVDAIDSVMQALAENPAEMMASVAEEVARLQSVASRPAPPPAPPAEDCTVTFRTSDDFMAMVNGWTDVALASDALCQRLAAAGAGVILTEASGVLLDKPYGWVKIGLFDLPSELGSPMRSTTITMLPAIEDGATQTVLREALFTAVDILERDQDAFFTSLAEEVAAMRATMGPASAN